MQVHYHTGVAAFESLFFVSVAEYGKDHTFYAERRFDDVGDVLFVGRGVGVFETLSADFHVSVEVVIGSVGYAPKFSPPEGEFIFEVGSRVTVEAEFFGVVVS